MTTTQLTLYNATLQKLGLRQLASLAEDNEARRTLDLFWNDDAQGFVLQRGMWKHAKTSVMLNNDPSFTAPTAFGGYTYRFTFPGDFLRTIALCSDPYYRFTIDEYDPQGNNQIYTDIAPIWLQYVGRTQGLIYAQWPPSFTQWVEYYLAQLAAPKLKLTQNDMKRLEAKGELALKHALSMDAFEGPMMQPRQGSWLRARRGNRLGYDRARNRLIG